MKSAWISDWNDCYYFAIDVCSFIGIIFIEDRYMVGIETLKWKR